MIIIKPFNLHIYQFGTTHQIQIEDEFARVGIVHQHNLAISGGSNKNRYMATVNYMGDYGNQKYQSKDRIGFSLKDDVDFLLEPPEIAKLC